MDNRSGKSADRGTLEGERPVKRGEGLAIAESALGGATLGLLLSRQPLPSGEICQ